MQMYIKYTHKKNNTLKRLLEKVNPWAVCKAFLILMQNISNAIVFFKAFYYQNVPQSLLHEPFIDSASKIKDQRRWGTQWGIFPVKIVCPSVWIMGSKVCITRGFHVKYEYGLSEYSHFTWLKELNVWSLVNRNIIHIVWIIMTVSMCL